MRVTTLCGGCHRAGFADTFNNRVRRVDATGIITTIAGNGTAGYAGDNGQATAAELNHPSGAAYDSAGNLYIADFSNLRVRKVAIDGTITTVAGNGEPDTSGTGLGDGLPAIAAALSGPYSVVVDASGNLYISDQSDQRIREIETSGTISTVAGNGKFGYSGDGGPASAAQVWWPSGLAIGPTGALYFADLQNGRIRAINAPSVVQVTSVLSRKSHGAAGAFDVYLPISGDPGIECRSGGADNSDTLVFSFSNPLTNVGSASVTNGTGSVASSNIDSNDAHNYIVSLTGVANAQIITVSLTNMTDAAGNSSPAVTAQMGVLLGDVNATGRVDAADVSLVRQQTLQPIDSSNFREDVNASGRIDAADVSVARQQTLTSLP
jgi:Dockerin type I domain/NHL repeat